MKKRISMRVKVSVLVFISISLLLILQLIIQLRQNKYNAKQTSYVYLKQIVNIIKQKEQEEQKLMQELKDNYIVRAKAISYIIEKNPELEHNPVELEKVCNLIGVDEVHLFDTKGKIYGGSVPRYYGFDFDSGEQMSFFKPMLSNYTLAMCQNPTPNTAEEKSMIYAIVWREDRKGMVQVGIEPGNLYEQLQSNEIVKIVEAMPTYEGIAILVANKNNGKILGATHRFDVGKNLSDIGLNNYKQYISHENSNSQIGFYKARVRDIPSYCTTDIYNNLYVTVISDVNFWNSSLFVSMAVVFLYLVMAVVVIVYILYKLNRKIQKERDSKIELQEKMLGDLKEQLAIIEGISKDYTDVVIVNLAKLTASMMKSNGKMLDYNEVKAKEGRPYYNTWELYIKKFVLPEDQNNLYEKVDLNNVTEKLDAQSEYTCSYRGFVNGSIINFQVKFMKVQDDELAKDIIVFAIRDIDSLLEEQKQRAVLEQEAKHDKLTGFFNRRAYEDDIAQLEKESLKSNFVFVSMDVNGLKQVNDTLGHAEGDNLLKGAAECIQHSFGAYGKVYRTGGDEFVAMIYTDIISDIAKDFDYIISKWNERNKLELAISTGYVIRKELSDDAANLTYMTKLADELMYESKARFYEHKGVDRRGQRDAYDALKETYAKVLKVNLTKDTYSIIHMLDEEKTESKGFSEKFSVWIKKFAESKMIHPEDVDRYLEGLSLETLRIYFTDKRKEYSITYRRKYSDESKEFKEVLMELLPSIEFSKDNQVVYLYVKKIER